MNRPTMEDAIAVGDGTLRGGLKSAAGWLLDVGDLAGQEKCLEMAGDMEPPLMGSNASFSREPERSVGESAGSDS